jgi:hypothetical protein
MERAKQANLIPPLDYYKVCELLKIVASSVSVEQACMLFKKISLTIILGN